MYISDIKKIFKTIRKETLLLLVITTLAIFLRVWQMWGWSINIAEASFAVEASEIVHNQNFYFAQTEYEGPFAIYFLIPSIFAFGNNIFFLRLSVVLVSITSILLLYLFTRKYYNEKIALLAAFILAITPNDILNSSVAFENPIIPFFIILSLYMFQKYAEIKKTRYLYIISFIFGIATITRLTFVFFIVA
jgi:4-amino-4-deoxy-L-arabinose transferase-like glycosyltransferase